MRDLERERLRAAEQALEAIIAFEDDVSWNIITRCEEDRDPNEIECPEYHYWHYLRSCDLHERDPETAIVTGDIRKVFPAKVLKGGPWEISE